MNCNLCHLSVDLKHAKQERDQALARCKKLESQAVEREKTNQMLSTEFVELEAEAGRMLAVVAAARNVGMNWKIGAPYGLDALSDALTALDATGKEST